MKHFNRCAFYRRAKVSNSLEKLAEAKGNRQELHHIIIIHLFRLCSTPVNTFPTHSPSHYLRTQCTGLTGAEKLSSELTNSQEKMSML